MADVFISYSRDDRAVVQPLAEAVARAGYSVWWDDELPPHRAYGDVIAEQIAAAKAAIVVWSASAAASQWVRAEADAARGAGKLIQVAIDDTMPPLPFTMLHAVSIAGWKGEADHPGWRKVQDSLAALCGGGAGESRAYQMPSTPPPPVPAPPRGRQGLLLAAIAVSMLVLAGLGWLAWSRRAPPPAVAPVESAGAPAAEPLPKPAPREARAPQPPPRAKAAPPRRAAAPAPMQMRGVRRYCLGPGRNSPTCQRLRAQYGR